MSNLFQTVKSLVKLSTDKLKGLITDTDAKMVDYMSLATGFGCGILACWLMKQGRVTQALTGMSKTVGTPKPVHRAAGHGQQKLILVVRMDLKMGKGKIAAQCSHATLAAYKRALDEAPEDLSSWKRTGQAKVVVKVNDEQSLYDIEAKAQETGLMTAIVSDAGMTQTAPGTITVMSVGPAPASLLDEVTGHLKLL